MTTTSALADEVASHFGNGDFAEKLTTFLEGCQQVIDAANLVFDERLEIRSGTSKYLAIDRQAYDRDTGQKLRSGGVYCFVASVDSTTKGLGTVKRGDVLKPATYKAPAKHARGNIFDEHNGLMGSDGKTPIQWTGPHYLK